MCGIRSVADKNFIFYISFCSFQQESGKEGDVSPLKYILRIYGDLFKFYLRRREVLDEDLVMGLRNKVACEATVTHSKILYIIYLFCEYISLAFLCCIPPSDFSLVL